MNALADKRVAEHLKAAYVSTYLKVGTFRIVNGQKQGGNVASYICLPEGQVLHAIPGTVDADTLLQEGRWALETHKLAQTTSTNLATGVTNPAKYRAAVRRAHVERVGRLNGNARANVMRRLDDKSLSDLAPMVAGLRGSNLFKGHFLLSLRPLAELDELYPVVWEAILNEKLSGLPVVVR